MATGYLWTNKRIASKPEVLATTSYEYQRVGTQLKIKVDTSNHCTSKGAYWDWRWAFTVSVNGREIASNIQIKPRTRLNIIGTTVYNASTGWATVDIGTATDTTISVTFFDTEANNNSKIRSIMAAASFTLKGIPPLPSVSLSANQSYPNKTHNSMKINYSVSGSYNYVRVFLNGKHYTDTTTNPFTISNLSPNTTYSVFAKAYGNGGFGKDSNTISFTTFVNPVSVSSSRVDNIEPFSATVYCSSNNINNTELYEFALCDKNKNPIGNAITTTNNYYNFKNLNEETSYYIRMRVKTKGSGAWSGYVYSPLFTTPADQARSYVKVNNSWKQGKIYYKKNGIWKKTKKIYYKRNGIWILSKNKYN